MANQVPEDMTVQNREVFPSARVPKEVTCLLQAQAMDLADEPIASVLRGGERIQRLRDFATAFRKQTIARERYTRLCGCGSACDDAGTPQSPRLHRTRGVRSLSERRRPRRTLGPSTEWPRCRSTVPRRVARPPNVPRDGSPPAGPRWRDVSPCTRSAVPRRSDSQASRKTLSELRNDKIGGIPRLPPPRSEPAARLNNRIRYEATMSLLYLLARWLDRISPAPIAYAHCDIPCGIYDPHHAQLAAHTVVRMVDLINQLDKPGASATPEQRQEYTNKLARYIATKEQHSEIAKNELRILWADYFKPEHLKTFPELHDLVWKALKTGSKARQEINLQAAEDLLKATNDIASIFWKTKGFETITAKAPYPTERLTVYPKFK